MKISQLAQVVTLIGGMTPGCRTPEGTTIYETKYVEDAGVNYEPCESDDSNSATMLRDWYRAEVELETCREEADDDFVDCSKVNDGTDCYEQNDQDNYVCAYYYADKVNQQPYRLCGENVFDIYGRPGDEDFDYGSMVMSERDPDGDGITTKWEFFMGYNPCAAVSYYSSECLSDGEYDYDGDGTPNGEDEYPYCSETEPNSDCV